MSWSSFIAMGDSFTEGVEDELPNGELRGWADLVAGQLAAQSPLAYANLAVRGRLFAEIVEEQLPVTLRSQPDLVSFAAGGNDALRRKVDVHGIIKRCDNVVGTLRASGSDVIIFTFIDISRRLPVKSLIGDRVGAMNTIMRDMAKRHDAYLVDLYRDPAFHDTRMWSADRLHLNTAGHHRVAGHVLRTLGVPANPEWTAELPAFEPQPWVERRQTDLYWARIYLAPWLYRRVTGKSSGDGRIAKRPDLTPF